MTKVFVVRVRMYSVVTASRAVVSTLIVDTAIVVFEISLLTWQSK